MTIQVRKTNSPRRRLLTIAGALDQSSYQQAPCSPVAEPEAVFKQTADQFKPSVPKSKIPKLNRSLQELNKINRQQYNFINNKQNAPFGSVNVLNTYVNQDQLEKKVQHL